MSKSKNETVNVPIQVLQDRPETPHQLIYADQMSAMAIGAFTSRITLAIESHAVGARVPVVTFVMPTAALHQLVAQVNAQLSDADVQKTLTDAFSEYSKGINVVPARDATEQERRNLAGVDSNKNTASVKQSPAEAAPRRPKPGSKIPH